MLITPGWHDAAARAEGPVSEARWHAAQDASPDVEPSHGPLEPRGHAAAAHAELEGPRHRP